MTTVSNSDIIKAAKKVKEYVEKNKKLPSTVTVGETKLTYQQCGYLFSKFINNIKKNVKLVKVGSAPSPDGDSINEKILPADYKSMASRTAQFIEKNNKLPNFCTTTKSKKRVRPKLFIYAFSKIVVFYANNNALPNYCLFNSEDFRKASATTKKTSKSSGLKPYLTSHGCSGMGQCTGYNCGPNSLQQNIYRLTGILVPESKLAAWAGTTTSGTDHDGLKTAVAKFNKTYKQNIKMTWKNFSDLGNSDSARWNALQNYINKGALFCHIKYRDKWGHYEVPKGVSGNNVIILNSLGNKCNAPAYCGYIETRAKSEHARYIREISQKSIAILTKG